MRAFGVVGLLFVCLALAACGESGGDATPEPEENVEGEVLDLRRDVLANLGGVVLADYQAFESAVSELEQATSTYATSASEADRQVAQAAWRKAMEVWQRCEVYQIGPAGLMDSVAGGEDIRDEIYSWPLNNPCRVDQEIVEGNFNDQAAFSNEPVNVRGLDALEYLLWSEGNTNACAPNSAINRDGLWSNLGELEIQSRRATYAHTLAVNVAEQATRLRAAWSAEQGNFIAELAKAGDSSTTYASTQAALNALSNAMFYAEKETKDMKLAQPVGLTECDDTICPDALESLFAQHSRENILSNLRAFEMLLLGAAPGTDAPGFDDLLRNVGADALADTMTQAIAAAIAAVEAIPGTSLASALTDNRDEVVAAYSAVQEVMTLLKTQFVSVLDLELPDRAEGDND